MNARLHLASALLMIRYRFFITRYYQSTQCDLECTVTAIFVIKVDKIDADDDVVDGCPNIAISWETRNLAGVVVRTDRTRYIVRAKAVGVRPAGEDCDVTAEPLHERVPRVPLAPNWNWSLHWINSLRDCCHNFTSSVHRYPRVPSPSPWFPYGSPSHPSSPWKRPQPLFPGDSSGDRTNKHEKVHTAKISVECFYFYFAERKGCFSNFHPTHWFFYLKVEICF